MFRTEDKPAPGRLVVVHGFLNTWSDELSLEDFATPQAAAKWLREAGLWTSRKLPSETDVERLRQFRETVRRYVLDRTSKAVIDQLKRYASDVHFKLVFDGAGRPELSAGGDGIDHAIGELLAILHTSVADGSFDRFKCCELETCGWAYYDHTKNKSGRWCSMKTCGSRHKAREYLKRKASKAT